MTLYEYLANYLYTNKLTTREFAKICGDVSHQYIQILTKGINPSTGKPVIPSITKLNSIARAMGLTLDELMQRVDDIDVNISMPVSNDVETPHIPLVGKVAAGEPIYDEYADEYIASRMSADCALVVQGDSMEPTYRDGDVIYVHMTPDIAYEGQVAVVIVEDEATLKHVYHIDNGLQLVSDNPKYPPMIKTFKDYSVIRILGTICGFTRMYK